MQLKELYMNKLMANATAGFVTEFHRRGHALLPSTLAKVSTVPLAELARGMLIFADVMNLYRHTPGFVIYRREVVVAWGVQHEYYSSLDAEMTSETNKSSYPLACKRAHLMEPPIPLKDCE